MNIAERATRIKPSPTMAVTAKAAELRRAGKDVIGLGAGEPDFPTPEHIKQAAIQAIHDNQTRYTAVDGTVELKEAIINKLRNDNGLEYAAEQIAVSSGSKQSIYNLMMALLNPGDECIIPTPYWVSYPDMCLLADASPVFIHTEARNGYKVSAEQLEQAITAKTKLLILNSPSNPTGAFYPKDELVALGEVLREHPQVMVASDDIYEKIIWHKDGFANMATACPNLRERVFLLNGVSKAYAMTGWRIGYVAGHASLVSEMKKIQSQSTSNPCSISQAAAVAAIAGDQKPVQEMACVFHKRHDMVVSGLNELPGVSCGRADGAFYAFADFNEIMSSSDFDNDVDFAAHILEKAQVALVPGSAFGADGCMRISYATSDELLQKALQRLDDLFTG